MRRDPRIARITCLSVGFVTCGFMVLFFGCAAQPGIMLAARLRAYRAPRTPHGLTIGTGKNPRESGYSRGMRLEKITCIRAAATSGRCDTSPERSEAYPGNVEASHPPGCPIRRTNRATRTLLEVVPRVNVQVPIRTHRRPRAALCGPVDGRSTQRVLCGELSHGYALHERPPRLPVKRRCRQTLL